MITKSLKVIPIRQEQDIVFSRQEGRDLGRELGFGLVDQSRIATAISELTRNILRYAGEGECRIRPVEDSDRTGVEVVCEDHGPGIPDVQAALVDGFSTTSTSFGIGLPGTRRLMDEMEITSTPRMGTRIMVRKWRKR